MYDSQSKSIRAVEPLAVLSNTDESITQFHAVKSSFGKFDYIQYEVVETLHMIQFYANNHLTSFCHRMFWALANLLKYF